MLYLLNQLKNTTNEDMEKTLDDNMKERLNFQVSYSSVEWNPQVPVYIDTFVCIYICGTVPGRRD